MKFFHNPKDSLSCKRIINTPKRKIGTDTVDKIDLFAGENNLSFYDGVCAIVDRTAGATTPQMGPQTLAALKGFVTMVQFLTETLRSTPLSSFISQLITNIRYKNYLIDQEGPDIANEKYENIGQLINMAQKFDELVEAENIDGKEALSKFLDEVALLTDLEETSD